MRLQRIISLPLTLLLLVVASACGGEAASNNRVGGGGMGGDVGSGGTGGNVGTGGVGGNVGTGGVGGNVGSGGVGGDIGVGGMGGDIGGGGMGGDIGSGGVGGNVGGGGMGGDIGSGGVGGNVGGGGVGGNVGGGGVGGNVGVGGMGGSGGTTAAGGAGGTSGACQFIECAGRVTACGDCSDNDGDGLIDNDDPECLGPCDNYEGEELLSGVGGETGEQCKADCYFDFGNGAGNDDCHWSRSCDPLEPKIQCTYNDGLLGGNDCPDTQSQLCEDVCVPLTPNGCDCFGCCTFPELEGMGPGGGDGYVYIGSESGCTFDTVTDPASCQACTPAGSCLNTCERCEICLGKPTIPADCFPGTGGTGGTGGNGGSGGTGGAGGAGGAGGTAGAGGDGGGMRCPVGKQVCGLPGDDPCPGGSFCLTGCCTEIVVQ